MSAAREEYIICKYGILEARRNFIQFPKIISKIQIYF